MLGVVLAASACECLTLAMASIEAYKWQRDVVAGDSIFFIENNKHHLEYIYTHK